VTAGDETGGRFRALGEPQKPRTRIHSRAIDCRRSSAWIARRHHHAFPLPAPVLAMRNLSRRVG
jgi:hypothetical protein